VSGLRSALDELERDDPVSMPDAQVVEDFEEGHRAIQRLMARQLGLLAQIDRRRTWATEGHLSTPSWLVDRYRTSWSAAKEQVRTARALEHMPRTAEALAAGGVSSCAVRALVAAQATREEEFGHSEDLLLDAARVHSVGELRRVVAYWRDAVDASRGMDPTERAWNARYLHASPTPEGMVRVDGNLDPETGETLLTALRAVTDAEARGAEGTDFRTPSQRRADALGEICRRWLDCAERPTVAGERPHVTVTMELDALEGRGGRSELDHSGPITHQTARRVACDASISRVITRGRSEPLDVGRRTPVVSAPMRRAVVVRDGRCRFPGCDRPHRWCDAHHVLHWADGGPTALNNLILLCRRHHRMIHAGPIRLELLQGQPVFRRDDGSILADRAPP
jgi:uncharacterized protein DUF222/HNH endonuclease